jgi:hypothetical protein
LANVGVRGKKIYRWSIRLSNALKFFYRFFTVAVAIFTVFVLKFVQKSIPTVKTLKKRRFYRWSCNSNGKNGKSNGKNATVAVAIFTVFVLKFPLEFDFCVGKRQKTLKNAKKRQKTLEQTVKTVKTALE